VVLWPEFIADVVLHPLAELGVAPDYYPVTRSLEPDWDALERKLGPQVRAIAMVHVFGQLQPVDRFRRLCDERGLVLIDDATHAFAGTWAGRPVGTLGDLGLTAPHKALPVFNGAYLYLDLPLDRALPRAAFALPLQPLDADCSVIDLSWRGKVADQAPWLSRLVKRREPYSTQLIRDRVLPHWAMDAESHAIVCDHDFEKHRTVRRSLYEIWWNWCTSRGLEPVFSKLHHEASPWAFVAYVGAPEFSRDWFRWGVRHGIEVFSWPTLPQPLAQPGSAVLELWKRLVGFPIHTEMNPDELQRTLAKVRETPEARSRTHN
jgi:hypothetical protein